ncbi:Terminase small subunit [Hydrogenophaga intermedia]|uniref:Terminase small subunit n=1 Tax=Hydrogenophaga intermedia TaxID=65786 RepID=A0A1L1PEW6_HYDIT|nr:terminase small subunit [Hydrogenophaga intermedia]CDN87344.1 Terminase small subunit [Hydrogenophaga intermedia]
MAKTEHGLTPQQELFALALAKGVSQAEAYRQAYPRSQRWKADAVHQQASRTAADPKVSARVTELRRQVAEKTVLESVEIIQEVYRLAVSDIADLMDADGKLLPPNKIPLNTRRALASIKVDEFGRIEYKFWDKNSALERAAKILGLFEKDNQQKGASLAELFNALDGKVIGPVPDAEAGGTGDTTEE